MTPADNIDGRRGGRSFLAKLRIALPVILAAGLAVQGCDTQQHASTPEPERPLIEKYPPMAGEPVLLDNRFPDWETFAWLSEKVLCIKTARPPSQRRAGQSSEATFCDPAPATLRTDGPAALTSKPLPQITPVDPQQREILLVGTVRGAVATVEVTMFGVTATSAVRYLPTSDDRQIGAYAAWLPRSGPERNGMNWSDMTVVARDNAGKVVAALD